MPNSVRTGLLHASTRLKLLHACPVLCWHAKTLSRKHTCLQELKKQQEEEEARQEEARLAAEQARLAAQFQSEQDAERGRRTTKEQEQQQGAPSGAGGSSRLQLGGGGELQASKSEGRRRVSGEWCDRVGWPQCTPCFGRLPRVAGMRAMILASTKITWEAACAKNFRLLLRVQS